ncbi:MAG: thiamine pyrophosphate-dependent enzyme [Planctomycetota bacterium]|jgi:2-oxoglutarate ferredoxin oxidoreductase subunit beta
MSDTCSLLTCGTEDEREFSLADYEGPQPRWCPGCGDHSILSATQRLLHDEKLTPESTVFVSGIGCSSRLPHHIHTYGFHGIHGRALPLATGIRLARPDLNIFVVMGDGDCCSIGAGHWIHAIRYNTRLVALMLDNNIYGLTKNQSSPTTPQGTPSLTQPKGSWLPALNPLTTTLGVTNASFVAQTADWAPGHVFATLKAAYHHPGFAFVRILQRCPKWTPGVFRDFAQQTAKTEILVHEDGIRDPEVETIFKSHIRHDPADIDGARRLADQPGTARLGLFFRDASFPSYDTLRQLPVHTVDEKMQLLDGEFDRYAV